MLNTKFQTQYSEQKAIIAIDRLKQAIKYYKINLNALFESYDTEKDSNLDFLEFSKLLLRIDNSLVEDDIVQAYY